MAIFEMIYGKRKDTIARKEKCMLKNENNFVCDLH